MSLIQKCGGQGMAEIILSKCMTNAICPNCYLSERKVYGVIDADNDRLYVFDEVSKQYLDYGTASILKDQYFLLADLKVELSKTVNDLGGAA